MTENYRSVVQAVKAELNARGQRWETNCDAFQITGRVAWRLRPYGAVLLVKSPAQNGCNLSSGPHAGKRVGHDAIGFPDGWVDILISGGPPDNINGPTWDWHPSGPQSGLAPWDLDAGLAPAPAEEEDQEQPPAAPDQQLLTALVNGLAVQVSDLNAKHAVLSGRVEKVLLYLDRIERRVKGGVKGRAALNLHLSPDRLPEDP